MSDNLSPEFKNAWEWENAHRRTETPIGIGTNGFGPGGIYALWLPPSKTESVRQFKDGRYQTVQMTAALPEEVRKLGTAAVKSFKRGSLSIGPEFMDYTAACIRLAYNVTDEDLAMLLLSGTKWHTPMITHLIGGQEVMDDLAKTPPALLPSPSIPAKRPVVAPPRRRRSLLSRILWR